jgi:hypothetical protein
VLRLLLYLLLREMKVQIHPQKIIVESMFMDILVVLIDVVKMTEAVMKTVKEAVMEISVLKVM